MALVDGRLPATFEGLKSHLDTEWIDRALQAKGALNGVSDARLKIVPPRSKASGCSAGKG